MQRVTGEAGGGGGGRGGGRGGERGAGRCVGLQAVKRNGWATTEKEYFTRMQGCDQAGGDKTLLWRGPARGGRGGGGSVVISLPEFQPISSPRLEAVHFLHPLLVGSSPWPCSGLSTTKSRSRQTAEFRPSIVCHLLDRRCRNN